MARPHHRKKHKQHLKAYQHNRDATEKISRSKVAGLFTFLGLGLGLAIAYFAVNTTAAMIIGAVAGGIAGYFIGKKMDEGV